MLGTNTVLKDNKQQSISAWDWNKNRELAVQTRKVHALLSYQSTKKDTFEEPSFWSQSDNLTLEQLYQYSLKGHHIATGYREEWNLKAHGSGTGYTYFLGIVVDAWANWGIRPPQSVQEYLTLLPESLVNQIAWIAETFDSTSENKKYVLVFDFRVLLAGEVIQEGYRYLIEQCPGSNHAFTVNEVPRLILGNKDANDKSVWIGGSVPTNICEQIIEKSRQKARIQNIQLDEDVPKLDIETTKIEGLVNDKYPILDESGKQKILDLKGKLHGSLSRNWQQTSLTLKEWVNLLNKGIHIAPGVFRYEQENQSRRSNKAFQETWFILLDVDEWNESELTPPKTIEEWKNSLPEEISQWITWVGESASSRSEQKPELRLRVAIAFEIPVEKEDFLAIAEYLHEMIPGTALTVAKDCVRLSYGNGRKDSENVWYGGYLPFSVLEKVIMKARADELEEARAQSEKTQFLREEHTRKRQNQDPESVTIAPWEAFNLHSNPHEYLEIEGFTRLDYEGSDGWINYSRPGGEKGKPSIGIRISSKGTWRVSRLSTSIEWLGDSTLSFLEYYCWCKYQLNIMGGISGSNATSFKTAMQKLADEGYGDWGKDFNRKYTNELKKYELNLPIEPNKYLEEKEKTNLNDNKLEAPMDPEKELEEQLANAYWSIEKNRLPHHYTIKHNYYTEPRGEPETLDIAKPFKLAWLDGPPGVAKTTFQAAHAARLPVEEMKIVAGPRKILCMNLASYLNEELDYKEEIDQNIALDMPVKYVHGDVKLSSEWPLPRAMVTCTIHSLLRVLRFLRKKNVTKIHLALDEIDFIIQALQSPQLYGKAQELLDEIKEIAEKQTVFLTGATVSAGLVLEFTKALGFTEDDVCQISVKKKVKKDAKLLFAKVKLTNIIDTIANEIEKLPKKTKIFIAFADKEGVKTLSQHPKIRERGKVQVVTSDNSQQKNIRKLITESTLEAMNIDVLIASPSIDVGINLFGEDTQVIIVRGSTFGAPVKTSWQQARRVRNTKRPIWYISGDIDWTKSLSLAEIQLQKKYKVYHNFLYYLANTRVFTGNEDKALQAEFDKQGKKLLDKIKDFTLEEALESNYLNSEQKQMLEDALRRAMLQARTEWEIQQELLFEEYFIKYHAEREGMIFERWYPETPAEEQIKNTKKNTSIRKKEEKTKYNEAVLTGLIEKEYTSLEEIENKRKEEGYQNEEYNEYDVAVEVNRRMQVTGAPNNLLDHKEEIREKETERAIRMFEQNIVPEDFQRKYEIYESLHYKELAVQRFYRRVNKDLTKTVCRPIQSIILTYLDQNLSYIGTSYTETFYREILHLAKQKIKIINNERVEITCSVSDAIFIHFPETLSSYKRMRRYGTSEAKALYNIVNKLFKQYLHKSFVICGEKSKKRELRYLENIEQYIDYFEQVVQAEQFYSQQLVEKWSSIEQIPESAIVDLTAKMQTVTEELTLEEEALAGIDI